MNVIELFAGAAGLAQGFERAQDFHTVALYDNFEPARFTYIENRPTASYFNKDVRELAITDVRETLAGRVLHGILGGPPCQGFSLAGKKQQQSEINQLVLAYARVVTELLPYFLVMENVPQLLFHPLFKPLLSQLEPHYLFTYGILNAARYGTPQTRHRLILIAYRRDLGIQPTLPPPSHGRRYQKLYSYYLPRSEDRIQLSTKNAASVLGADPVIRGKVAWKIDRVSPSITPELLRLVTVGQAIGDLLVTADKPGATTAYAKAPTSDYQRLLRGRQTEVSNCLARRHTVEMIDQMRDVREGGILNADASGSRNQEHYSQAYGRLHRAGLARTLTTYFQNVGSGRFFHYSESRTLTIREGARLQGFSDDFVFHGSLETQMQLVGNAVPLPLAEAIGRHIKRELRYQLLT